MNDKIIDVFEELIAYYNTMVLTNSLKFKVRNFRKVINIIKKYDKKIEKGQELCNIKGIGEGTINRINEILETGTLLEIKTNNDTKDTSKDLLDLQRITGIGPANANKLLKNNINLELILETYKKNPQDDFFNRFTHHQMIGIKYFHDIENRIPYQEISEIDNYIQKKIENIDENLNSVICGSYRRKKPTSGDIDILITHKNFKRACDIEDFEDYLHDIIDLLKLDKFIVDDLTFSGHTKYMGMCRYKNNFCRRIDIRLVPLDSYGSSLLYFTGSGEFNKNMRSYALKKGYTINEYGLYSLKLDKKTNKKVKGLKIKTNTEEDFFKALDISYVPPEERTENVKF